MQIDNVCLFYGEEAYKRRNYKEQLKKQVAGPGSINYSFFEGKGIDFSAVYDSVVTLPFFAEKRLVIVENSGKFKASKKSSAQEEGEGEGDASFADHMIEKILKDLPETTCLAFFEEEVNRSKKIYKLIASKGKVIECAPDGRDKVLRWLAKGFAADNKKIRQSTAELLIDRVGTNYDRLRREYEKIIAYAGDEEVITDEHVLAVTSEDIESRIFDMLDAMCVKNKAKVLESYYGLTVNKEHPLYLLAMIRIQFRTMLQVAELDMEGSSKYQIASRLKKRDFIVEKSLRNLRYFSRDRLIEILDKISETDMKIKTGDIDEQIGVELMLLEFSS